MTTYDDALREEAIDSLTRLINDGWLMGVAVFGTDDCCQHGPHTDCPSTGYGLCDRFGPHTPGGSDCNRAAAFIMRPSDDLMTPELQTLIMAEETTV